MTATKDYKAGYKQALDDLSFQVYQIKDKVGELSVKEVEKVIDKLEYYLKGE